MMVHPRIRLKTLGTFSSGWWRDSSDHFRNAIGGSHVMMPSHSLVSYACLYHSWVTCKLFNLKINLLLWSKWVAAWCTPCEQSPLALFGSKMMVMIPSQHWTFFGVHSVNKSIGWSACLLPTPPRATTHLEKIGVGTHSAIWVAFNRYKDVNLLRRVCSSLS